MAFSSKRSDKSKKDTSFCDLVDTEMFKRLSTKVTNLEALVNKMWYELESEEKGNEELRKMNEELTKEVNRKDVEMNEMSAEVNDLKNKVKEMSIEVDNHQQKLSDKETDEEIIKQANSIIERNKEFEESVDTVCTVKDEIKSTYAQILKEKDEIKNNRQNDENVNIKQEVKEIIRKNPKLIRETVDMKKSVIIMGKKEEEIKNRIDRDETELNLIVSLIILRKYYKNTSINVIFSSLYTEMKLD